MEIWELVARESIRDLVARYNANGDSGRFGPMLELFADDAVMELPDGVYRGQAEIRAMLDGVAARTGDRPGSGAKFIRHSVTTHQIDLSDPTSATGRAYYSVLTDAGLDHWGRYLDEYRASDGRWLFARRKVTLDGAIEGSWAGQG